MLRSTTALPQPSARRPTGPSTAGSTALLGLDPRALWRAFTKESFAFWCLCSYFFIEYVRPQQIYSAIDGLPFGKFTLGITLVAYVLEGVRSRRLQMVDALLLAYTVIIVASSFTAYRPEEAFGDWMLFLNWLLMYFLVSHIVTTPRRTLIFWLLFMLWCLKMSQHGTRSWVTRGFAFSTWGASGAPGWFQNSGEFAIQMCIFLPMSYHLIMGLRPRLTRWRFWGLMLVLPATAIASLLASSSRGGQLGLVAVILFMVGQSRRRVRGLIVAGVTLMAVWAVLPAEQKERFETMGDDQTSQNRLTYWEDGIEIMKRHPILGIGYNNWIPYYRQYYNPQGELPHNIFVEAGSELGYTGLLGFVALIMATFATNFRSRRLAEDLPEWGPLLRRMAFGLDGALIGFMVSGFFVTVLYYPFFWANLSLTAALFETTRRAARQAKRARVRAHPRAGGTPEVKGLPGRLGTNGDTDWVGG